MKTMVLIVSFVLASIAHATEATKSSVSALQAASTQQSASEFMYIPAAGIGRLQLAPKIATTQYESTGNNTGNKYTTEYKSQLMEFSYDYAFEQTGMALSLGSFFGSSSVSSTTNGSKSEYKSSGNGDVNLALRKLIEAPNGKVQFGANLQLSPGKEKAASRNENGNMYSGGHSLTAFVGIELPTSFGVAGGLLSYSLMGKRETEARDYQETTTGLNMMTLSGFAEFKQNAANVWGAALALESRESGAYEDSDGEKGDYDATQKMAVSAYGRLQLTEAVSVKPMIGYSTLLTKNVNSVTYDKSENIDMSVGLLMNF